MLSAALSPLWTTSFLLYILLSRAPQIITTIQLNSQALLLLSWVQSCATADRDWLDLIDQAVGMSTTQACTGEWRLTRERCSCAASLACSVYRVWCLPVFKSIQTPATRITTLSLTCLYALTVIIFETWLKQQITHMVLKHEYDWLHLFLIAVLIWENFTKITGLFVSTLEKKHLINWFSSSQNYYLTSLNQLNIIPTKLISVG